MEQKKLDLKHLRIFGCLAYVKDLGQLRKLDKRSKMVKFVGYTQTGYRLWDSIKKKMIVSREVHFNEEENGNTKQKENKIKSCVQHEEDLDEEHEEIGNISEEDLKINEEHLEAEENDEDATSVENNNNITQEQAEERTLRRSHRQTKFPDRYNAYTFLTYEEVMKSKDKKKWMKAIQEEKNSLKKNKTWDLVSINEARGKKCLTSRWVFQKKMVNTKQDSLRM